MTASSLSVISQTMELGLFRSTILDSMDAAAPFNFSENAENDYNQI